MSDQDHLESCPLCELLAAESIPPKNKGEMCCVLKWGKRRVAVLSAHNDDAPAEAVIEAIKLLGAGDGKSVLKEFNEVAGHWGVEAVPAGELTEIGKSVVRNG